MKFYKKEKLLVALLLLLIFSFMFITISRGRLLFLGLAVITYMLIYGKVKILFYSGLILTITIILIKDFNENMYNFISWKIKSE